MKLKRTQIGKIREKAIRNFYEWLILRFQEFYFCGWTLDEIFLFQFFPRFRNFVDYGWCFEVSTMIMCTLRDQESARIVRGYVGPERYMHSWVELKFRGSWYVIDPIFLWEVMAEPKEFYYEEAMPKITYVCKHRKFWSWQICSQLETKMRATESSYLWLEWTIFSPGHNKTLAIPEDCVARNVLSDVHGHYLIPFPKELGESEPNVIISSRIVAEFMIKPTRTRPKVRTIKQALRIQKGYTALINELAQRKTEEVGT